MTEGVSGANRVSFNPEKGSFAVSKKGDPKKLANLKKNNEKTNSLVKKLNLNKLTQTDPVVAGKQKKLLPIEFDAKPVKTPSTRTVLEIPRGNQKKVNEFASNTRKALKGR